MTPRPHHLLSAVATALALAVGGCTPTGAADPTPLPSATAAPTSNDSTTPTGSPTDTPDPTPTPAPSATPTDSPAPTDAELVELVNAYRNITLDLPELPVDEARQYIADHAAELTTPDGTARERLALQIGDDAQFITRGRPSTAILDRPTPDGQEWSTTGCIATRGRTTEIATGDPAENDPFVSFFTEVELRVAPDDSGGWALVNYDPPPAEDQVDCVPPALAAAAEENWVAVNGLLTEWAEDGQPAERLTPLRPLVSEAYFEELSQLVGVTESTYDPDVEILFGFQPVSARPGEVRARWCYDLSKDPSARSIDIATGDVTDLSQQGPLIVRGSWTRSDNGWIFDETLGARDAEEGESPCN